MLDLYLRDAHGIVYDGFGNTLAGTQMSEARGSYWLVLPGPSAAALRMALDMIEPDRADLLALIVSEHGPDEAEEEAEAAQVATASWRFQGWITEVTATEVGWPIAGGRDQIEANIEMPIYSGAAIRAEMQAQLAPPGRRERKSCSALRCGRAS